MGHAYRGFRLVHVLPAGASCTEGIYLDILHADVHIHLFRHRQHCHRTGRGMDAALGFRFRHTLYPVHAAFKLHSAVSTGAGNLGHHFLKAPQLRGVGVHQFHGPAHGIRVPGVHAEQHFRKQGGFFPTGPCPDLKDDVLVVIRIPGQQHQGQLLFIFFQHRFQRFRFFPGYIRQFRIAVFFRNGHVVVKKLFLLLIFPPHRYDLLQLRMGLCIF